MLGYLIILFLSSDDGLICNLVTEFNGFGEPKQHSCELTASADRSSKVVNELKSNPTVLIH